MTTIRYWLSVKEAAPLVGRTPKQIYDQIRLGSFPFIYRRGRGDSGAIYISARDLGLIPSASASDEPRAASAAAQKQ